MLKVEELEKQLNQGMAEGIYLLYGEETFLLEQQLKKIKNLLLHEILESSKEKEKVEVVVQAKS